jgi:N-acetyl-gamma-glutamyl-phosphate reductase
VQKEIPELPAVRNTHGLILGGFTVSKTDPRCLSLVCVLDNLLKGAASQAVQNLNLAFKLKDEFTGLNP